MPAPLNAALERRIKSEESIIKGLKNLKEKLVAISDYFAQVPSLLWGGAYFLCILLFAVIFTFSSSGFYHSTSQFERSLDYDSQEILESIESILKPMSNFSPDSYDGWTLAEDKFSVHSLRTYENKVEFSVYTMFTRNTDAVGKNTTFYFIRNPELSTCTENDCYSTRILQTNEPILDKEKKLITLIPQVLSYYSDISLIETPFALDSKIDGYVAAKNGFPSESSGNFGRMLYLSIVTITTLGYGDIVPISDLNRFLVGLESILGMVIIGLFLNSLSRERRDAL